MTTQTRTTRSTVVVATAIVGGLALTGAGASWALAAVQDVASGPTTGSATADGTGLAGLDLDIGGAKVTVEFGDVAEPRLTTSGPAAERWTIRRDDGDLVVKSPRRYFGFGDGLCLPWCFDDRNAREAVLTLPRALDGGALDADISLGAGSVHVFGGFDDLDVEIGAGDARVDGGARTFSLSIGAGDAEIALADVEDADFDIASGRAGVELTGAAPSNVDIEVSVGELDIALPNVPYRVDSRVTMGDLRNELRVDPTSSRQVRVEVSVGDVALRAGAR